MGKGSIMKKTKLYMTMGQLVVSIAATTMACLAILTDWGWQYPLIFLGISIILVIVNFVLLIVGLKMGQKED